MPWRSAWRSRSGPLWGSGPYWGSWFHRGSWISWSHWRSGSVPWRSAWRSRFWPLWGSWFQWRSGSYWGSGPYWGSGFHWGSGLFRGSRSYWWSLSWSRLIPMPFHFSHRFVQDFSSQIYKIKIEFWFYDVFIKFRFSKKATRLNLVNVKSK